MENLTAKHAMSASDLNRYLTEQGYVYGQYVVLYRGDYRSYEYSDDAAAKPRRRRPASRFPPIWTQCRIYRVPHLEIQRGLQLLSGLDFPGGLFRGEQAALKNLRVGQVSQVLTEEDRYAVVLKLDPSGQHLCQ